MKPWERYQEKSGPWEKYRDGGERSVTETLARAPLVTLKGLAKGAASLGDPVNAALNPFLTRMGLPPLKPASEAMGGVLESVGFPRSDTNMEMLAEKAAQGGAGAVAYGPLFGGKLHTGSLVTSGVAAGTGGELSRQGGGSELEQALAAVGLSFGVDAAKGGAALLNAVANPKNSPFAKRGQEQIAGNILYRLASSPGAAKKGGWNAKELVPGSPPTTAQASQDYGLALAEKGLGQSVPEIGRRLHERAGVQNTARQELLRKAFGTADDLAAAVSARSSDAAVDYGPILAKPVKVTPELVELTKRPAVAAAIKRANDIAANEGVSLGSPVESMRGLHYMKLALDDMIEKAPTDPGYGRNTLRALTKAKNDLISLMDNFSPEYKAAREAFAAASKPINQMELGQKAIQSATSKANIQGDYYKLMLSNLNRFVLNNKKELSKTLSEGQQKVLRDVIADMERGAKVEGMQAVKGSDTFRNMTVAHLIGRTLGGEMGGGGSIPNDLLRPISFIFKYSDERIMDLLGDAIMDPAVAMKLLSKASPRAMETVGQVLKRKVQEQTAAQTASRQ